MRLVIRYVDWLAMIARTSVQDNPTNPGSSPARAIPK